MSGPPAWLTEFANEAAAHIHPVDAKAPLGCHYHHEERGWEITLFTARVETVGGARDGELHSARFRVDLLGLCSIFTSIESVHWQAHRLGRRDDLGPHVAIEGTARGERIWLRIPATAPDQFVPWRETSSNSNQWEEVG